MGGLRAGLAVVGVHYAANLAHGIAHWGVPVAVTPAQSVFLVLVVGAAPLGSLWLLGTERRSLAWGSLAAVLLGSLVFGLAFHYVLESADHVASVPPGAWHAPFLGTAAAITVADGGGALVSLWFARQS